MVAKNVADDSKCHMDDILSLDVSSDRKLVVSGQVGKSPSVFVWDSETTEVKARFTLKPTARGVQACSLSPCQRYVACVDLHNDHHVYIYNIKKNKMLLSIEGGKEKVVHVAWSKKPDDLRFCTVGLKELKFWNPADASKRLFVKGVFGTKGKQTGMNCVAFDDAGVAYTAGANGMIYIWDDQSQLDKVLKGHAAECVALNHDQGKLISGGKDNKINIYAAAGGSYTLEKSIEFENSFPKSID